MKQEKQEKPSQEKVLIAYLLEHEDLEVRAVATALRELRKQRERAIETLKSVTAQLRMDLKYIVFDLEATRRERDALKE